ncbi:arylesterase [Erythrobacter sp.]|uniref:arylesterase n=1 Tax=Erythrobacter sp. TaxID=1042 RepID=UPI002EBD2370|nr:arylesterase [Erythrobacter sp.]
MSGRSGVSRLAAGWLAGLALLLAACGAEAEIEEPAADDTLDEAAIPVMSDELLIVAFGDSLFAGYNLAEDEGYPEKLEAALRFRGIDARVVDAGVSGDTSAAGRDRLLYVLESLEEEPDLFILELGGNDLLRGISPEETRANFEEMLRTLRGRDIPVLIMGMRAPPNYGPEYQQEFDALYSELAEDYDTALIPFWLEDIYQRPELFLDDRIHPTAEGVEALVQSTVDAVAAELPERERRPAQPEPAEAADS